LPGFILSVEWHSLFVGACKLFSRFSQFVLLLLALNALMHDWQIQLGSCFNDFACLIKSAGTFSEKHQQGVELFAEQLFACMQIGHFD